MPDRDESDVTAATDSGETHATFVRTMANSMLRATFWPVGLTVLFATVVATFWAGVPGLFSALIGGAVVFGSTVATIGLMRLSAGMQPLFVMATSLGGYLIKMFVLLIVLGLLRGVEGLHVMSLAATMLAAILVCAGAEMRGFQKVRVPTIVPRTES